MAGRRPARLIVVDCLLWTIASALCAVDCPPNLSARKLCHGSHVPFARDHTRDSTLRPNSINFKVTAKEN